MFRFSVGLYFCLETLATNATVATHRPGILQRSPPTMMVRENCLQHEYIDVGPCVRRSLTITAFLIIVAPLILADALQAGAAQVAVNYSNSLDF